MLRVLCLTALGLLVPLGDVIAQNAEPSAMRGVVRAVNEAAISTDVAARVVKLPFREGETFSQSQVLVEFECDRLKAELKAAEAERRGQHAAWENSSRLYQLRAAGGHDVTIAAAAHEKAAAVVEGLDARVKQCRILAPFSGRVVDLFVRLHETPSSSQPLIRIIDETVLEIELLLPAASFTDVKPGVRFQLKIDETGVVIEGEITRVGGSLDIVSQTFKAAGKPRGAVVGVLPGMSGAVALKKSGS